METLKTELRSNVMSSAAGLSKYKHVICQIYYWL